MAEGRLNHADSRCRDTDVEASQLRDQLGATMDNLRGLSGEHDALRGELRAAHEDLEVKRCGASVLSSLVWYATDAAENSSLFGG